MGWLSTILSTSLLAVLRRLHTPARHRDLGMGFFRFPPEIVLMILSHLGLGDRLSLALTCKAFYRLYFPTDARPPFELKELREFLLGLERDVPNVVYCHHCSKLHLWKKPDSISGYNGIPWGCRRQCFLWGAGGYFLDNQTARLIMNAHFYGSSHGLDVVTLNKASSRVYRDFSLAWSCQARIIDDHLLVSYTMRLTNDEGVAFRLRKGIDEEGPPICDHLRTSNNFYTIFHLRGLQLPELKKSPKGLFRPCIMSVKSCPVCLTDYCIDISSDNDQEGWVITLTKYHDVGKARSPHDREWQLITSVGLEDDSPRCMHKSTWPPGRIRQIWHQGSDTEPEQEATWAIENSSLEKWLNEGMLPEPEDR